VEALQRLSSRPDVDVLVLARGGGDATALLPWSDEDLCRAVAACPVPVVSAIGHESDRPLCDEVADLRCGTPSIAAHAVVPDRHQLEAELAGLIEAATRLVDRRRELDRERLGRVDVTSALAAGMQRRPAGYATPPTAWSGHTRAPTCNCPGGAWTTATGAGRWPHSSSPAGAGRKRWAAMPVPCLPNM